MKLSGIAVESCYEVDEEDEEEEEESLLLWLLPPQPPPPLPNADKQETPPVIPSPVQPELNALITHHYQ